MGNRKEEILIVALHLFARDGYEAVSVSQIAGELDRVVTWRSLFLVKVPSGPDFQRILTTENSLRTGEIGRASCRERV